MWKNQTWMILRMVVTTEISSLFMTLKSEKPILYVTSCPILLSKTLQYLRTFLKKLISSPLIHWMKQRRSIEVCVREAGPAGMRKMSLMCTFICALVLTIPLVRVPTSPGGKGCAFLPIPNSDSYCGVLQRASTQQCLLQPTRPALISKKIHV